MLSPRSISLVSAWFVLFIKLSLLRKTSVKRSSNLTLCCSCSFNLQKCSVFKPCYATIFFSLTLLVYFHKIRQKCSPWESEVSYPCARTLFLLPSNCTTWEAPGFLCLCRSKTCIRFFFKLLSRFVITSRLISAPMSFLLLSSSWWASFRDASLAFLSLLTALRSSWYSSFLSSMYSVAICPNSIAFFTHLLWLQASIFRVFKTTSK